MQRTTKRGIVIPSDLAAVRTWAHRAAYQRAIAEGKSVPAAHARGDYAAKTVARRHTKEWRAKEVERARRALQRWEDGHDRKPWTMGLRLPQHRGD